MKLLAYVLLFFLSFAAKEVSASSGILYSSAPIQIDGDAINVDANSIVPISSLLIQPDCDGRCCMNISGKAYAYIPFNYAVFG